MMSSSPKVVKLLGGASFRSFRNLWMLEELGVEYEHIATVMPGSEQVHKLNPLGKVPVLIIEEGAGTGTASDHYFVLYESTAINTYLGDKYRNANTTNSCFLVPSPSNLQERALYDQTISVLISELDSQGLWIHRKHAQMGNVFGTIPDAVQHARKYFHKTNRALIQQLKGSGGPYLLGKHFTAADITYVHCLDWSSAIGWDDKWKADESVVEYANLCKGRESYQKVKKIRDQEAAAMKKQRRSKI
jgi:glutathione S-transferase